MDLNLQATRSYSVGAPKAVLYQFDRVKAMNPRGLLMAYEEAAVKPVASDIDAFLVGSQGMALEELPAEQLRLVDWAINHIESVLAAPSSASWTKRWLSVLMAEAKKGFHPEIPKYGFGDPVSTAVISTAVQSLTQSGAVRHGAESFNFYFPQVSK